MSSSESNVNRYNQGFGKFGPMEQYKDGKWVLAHDYLMLEGILIRREATINTLEKYIETSDKQISSLKETLGQEIEDNNTLYSLQVRKCNAISGLAVLTIVLAVANIAQFVARIL